MWQKITSDPQANSISIGNLLAKVNPELNSAEIIYAVTKIEGDGLIVLERRDIVKEKATSNQSEQIDVEIKKYPTELIGEWWLKSE